MKRIALSLCLLLTLGMSGCWFGLRKHKSPTIPPPPTTAPAPAPETKPETKPQTKPETKPEIKPETKLETEPVQISPELPEVAPETKQPAPKKAPRKPVQPVLPAAPTAPATTPATVAPAPQSVPQLSVLLTPEQRNQFEADYASSLASAQEGLVRTGGYTLSAAQKESVSRIRSFMHEAEELHPRDLPTAAQLARRAAVLSQDLAQSLR